MKRVLHFAFMWSAATAALNVTPNHQYSFEQCLLSKPNSFGTCLGIGALSKLQSIDDDPAYNIVDGVIFLRDEHQPRDAGYFLEQDPSNFRYGYFKVNKAFI